MAWLKPGRGAGRAFRLPGAGAAMGEYLGRIGRLAPCSLEGGLPSALSRVWLLDRSPSSQILSSEQVGARLQRVRDGGTKCLEILVGGPDGFSPETVSRLRPELKWSFGPLTLPHELAAVVAAEQVYRAFTILNGAPYHGGH